jgi:hypothetical protein
MKRTWKPTASGILNIVVGVSGISLVMAISIGYQSLYGLAFLPLAIPPLVGGLYALRRRRWWVTLACSIIGFFPIGVAAIILIALSKDEFNKPVSKIVIVNQ